MSKYEVKAIRHFSAVFLGDKRVTQWPLIDEDACKVADMLNQETAPLLDELATKDAVILAQSERIKELERFLRGVADNEPNPTVIKKSPHMGYYKALAFELAYVCQRAKSLLQPEESEADNG